MKSNYSKVHRVQIENLNKCKKFSKETIEIMKLVPLIEKNPLFRKAMLNVKKKSESLLLYNLNNKVYGEYLSITEAAKHLNCYEKTITRALKTE